MDGALCPPLVTGRRTRIEAKNRSSYPHLKNPQKTSILRVLIQHDT